MTDQDQVWLRPNLDFDLVRQANNSILHTTRIGDMHGKGSILVSSARRVEVLSALRMLQWTEGIVRGEKMMVRWKEGCEARLIWRGNIEVQGVFGNGEILPRFDITLSGKTTVAEALEKADRLVNIVLRMQGASIEDLEVALDSVGR